jgi:uncharacterized protein with NAD-binding domain and iron-sulfur cluster
MPKIIIMGGGIGGLTVAHELVASSIASNYEIHIYERHNNIGGMARGGQKKL